MKTEGCKQICLKVAQQWKLTFSSGNGSKTLSALWSKDKAHDKVIERAKISLWRHRVKARMDTLTRLTRFMLYDRDSYRSHSDMWSSPLFIITSLAASSHSLQFKHAIRLKVSGEAVMSYCISQDNWGRLFHLQCRIAVSEWISESEGECKFRGVKKMWGGSRSPSTHTTPANTLQKPPQLHSR